RELSGQEVHRNSQLSSFESGQFSHIQPSQITRPAEFMKSQHENIHVPRTNGLLNIYNAAAARKFPQYNSRQFPEGSSTTNTSNHYILPTSETRGVTLPGRKSKEKYKPTYPTLTSYGTIGSNIP